MVDEDPAHHLCDHRVELRPITARTAVSFGCIGNRVYTGAGDADAYFAIPGPQLAAVEQSLATIVRANETLEQFHKARAAELCAASSL